MLIMGLQGLMKELRTAADPNGSRRKEFLDFGLLVASALGAVLQEMEFKEDSNEEIIRVRLLRQLGVLTLQDSVVGLAGLEERISNRLNSYATKEDVGALLERLERLETQLTPATQERDEAVETAQKTTEVLEPLATSLGTDVKGLRTQIEQMQARVAKLDSLEAGKDAWMAGKTRLEAEVAELYSVEEVNAILRAVCTEFQVDWEDEVKADFDARCRVSPKASATDVLQLGTSGERKSDPSDELAQAVAEFDSTI